jgi:predicted RNase H-like HicB family nuclease
LPSFGRVSGSDLAWTVVPVTASRRFPAVGRHLGFDILFAYLDSMAPSSESEVMRHEFTAVYEHDDDWIVAYCPEIPGANGQGRTKEEARASLSDAIALILEDRREDGLRGVPAEAERETITVEVSDSRAA